MKWNGKELYDIGSWDLDSMGFNRNLEKLNFNTTNDPKFVILKIVNTKDPLTD